MKVKIVLDIIDDDARIRTYAKIASNEIKNTINEKFKSLGRVESIEIEDMNTCSANQPVESKYNIATLDIKEGHYYKIPDIKNDCFYYGKVLRIFNKGIERYARVRDVRTGDINIIDISFFFIDEKWTEVREQDE